MQAVREVSLLVSHAMQHGEGASEDIVVCHLATVDHPIAGRDFSDIDGLHGEE